MSDCIFCKIVAKQIPATLVHEDARTVAFMDIAPVNRGHVLVAPKIHSENLYALDEEQAGAVFVVAARLARAIRDAFAPPALSVYQANGALAGQQVFHFHVHLIPRYDHDDMKLVLPRKNPKRDSLQDDAASIRAKLG